MYILWSQQISSDYFTSEQLKELEIARDSRQVSLELASAVLSSETGAFSCQRPEYLPSRQPFVLSLLECNEFFQLYSAVLSR